MADTPSLFGATPEAIQQAREAALNTQAAQYAEMNPYQRAAMSMYKGGNQLGGAIGGMLGAQDPAMQKATLMKQLSSQANTSTPEGMLQFAKSLQSNGLAQEAFQASQQAQAMKMQTATLGKTQAELDKFTQTNAQELKLREALAALPANATEQETLAAVTQFGSAGDIMKVVERSSNQKAAREQALVLAEQNNAAKVEAARQRGEDQKVIAQMQIDGRLQIAQLTAALKQSLAGNKPLSASLQKSEDTDLTSIDNYKAQQEALAPSIANLTRNEKGVRKLELGPLNNAYYVSRNAMNQSTPESRAYEGLKSAVDTAVNLQVSAEKGVQTDKDVVRFAQALVAAYGKNDTEATLAALKRYDASIKSASERTRARLESRRKSQGVEAYSPPESSLGTPSNPIKLD